MGERDLGPKITLMRDRDEPDPSDGVDEELDGTIAEVLPCDEITARPDEDLAESKEIDEHDTPEDDYVQQGSDFARGVVGAEPTAEDLEALTRRGREPTVRSKHRR
jgi:hypothetical protein